MAQHLLSAAKCKSAPKGRYGDGAGLYLYKQSPDVGQWVYRFTWGKVRKEMGLGAFPKIPLAVARRMAEKWALVRADGTNPMEARDEERRQKEAPTNTLSSLIDAAFEVERHNLRDNGEAGRWLSPLNVHIRPKLGKRNVESLTQHDIEKTLQPIWRTKPIAASKALNRLGKVMKHGAARGLQVDLNAVLLAKALLGQQGHVEKHIPSMPWEEVPSFYESLTDGTPTHLALRLLILTGARSRPIRFAHECQLDGNVWTIPAEGEGARQKGKKGKSAPFRIPLSQEAMQVVSEAMAQGRDGFLFPSPRKGVISDATMARMMERRGLTYRPHGFRASLRNWCAHEGVPEHLGEMTLSHAIGNKVSRAYRTTDELESRESLLERWAGFVTGKTAAPTNILKFNFDGTA